METNRKENQALSSSGDIQALLELANAFAGQKDLFSLLELIKDKTTKQMKADRASIFLVDNDTNELWTLMADGVNVIRFPFGKGIVGSVIQDQTILNIPDAENDPRFFGDVDKKTGYKTRNILCAPMRNRFGKSVGAIEVLNKNEGAFTKQDESLLLILCTLSAVAVENVEMLEDVQESFKQVNLLNKIQRQSNYVVNLNSALEQVLQALVENIQSPCGLIVLFDAAGTPVCSCSLSDGDTGTFYLNTPEAEKWIGKTPSLEQLLNKVDERKEQLESEDMIVSAVSAVAAMKDKDSLVGYVEVCESRAKERLFSKRAMDFLKVVAGQVVSFIVNKKLVEEKNRSEKMAAVGNMVSTIVHDIKNPLAGISGYAQMIRRKTEDAKIHTFVDVMLEELTRLEDMNNEILTFVRGETLKLEIEEVTSEKFVDDICRIIEQNFKDNGVALSVDLGYKGKISIDKNKMIRVFVNIANNARDAMPEGGRFTISNREDEGNMVEFALKDSGTGMPPEIKARIFEPFFTHGKEGGTGLGMAITKNIIDKHAGEVRIESSPDKGTTFFIKLPK